MANKEDYDQTAQIVAVWSGSTLFAFVILVDTWVYAILGLTVIRKKTFGTDKSRSLLILRIMVIQYNLNGSNTDGSFTLDDSNSFFSPYKILPIAQENKYLGFFFLFYHGIVCCVYSLESPHRGDSNEYTQHTIIM